MKSISTWTKLAEAVGVPYRRLCVWRERDDWPITRNKPKRGFTDTHFFLAKCSQRWQILLIKRHGRSLTQFTLLCLCVYKLFWHTETQLYCSAKRMKPLRIIPVTLLLIASCTKTPPRTSANASAAEVTFLTLPSSASEIRYWDDGHNRIASFMIPEPDFRALFSSVEFSAITKPMY